MYINKFLGRALVFRNGLQVGFNWVHGNGETSKTSACIAAYHRPDSITWRWAIYWHKPKRLICIPKISKFRKCIFVLLPLIGGFRFSWQDHMFRKEGKS